MIGQTAFHYIPSSIVLLDAKQSGDNLYPFFGIPGWANRITLLFNEVSLSNTDSLEIVIGDHNGFASSGYSGAVTYISVATVGSVNFSVCFSFPFGNAALKLSGSVEMNRQSGNSWTINGILGSTTTALTYFVGGIKSLTGSLDRVMVRGSTSLSTVDNGTISISYE